MSTKPLVKQYEPKTLDDVVGHTDITNVLKSFVKSYKSGVFDFPNMLFAGPAGTGKTATAHALGRDLFGPEYGSCFMDFNASSERGIDFIREKVKTLAQTMPAAGITVIFLDEADNLTSDAQFALRRVMEDYTQTCRFILSCNYPGKLIEPIRSRCSARFTFGKVSDDEMLTLLRKIALAEKINITSGAAARAIKLADGRPRNLLNITNLLQGLNKEITILDVANIFKDSPEAVVAEIFAMTNPIEADKRLIKLINDGCDTEELIEVIFNHVRDSSDKDIAIKAKILMEIGDAAGRIAMGANPLIQLRTIYWARHHLVGVKMI